MLIISYDKQLSINVGDHWYYKFKTNELTAHFETNELRSSDFDSNRVYVKEFYSQYLTDEFKILFDKYINHRQDMEPRETLKFSSMVNGKYSEASYCKSLESWWDELQKGYIPASFYRKASLADKNNLRHLMSGDFNTYSYNVLKPYIDIIKLNQPVIKECSDIFDFFSKLPSLEDIKKQFPPQNPILTYDEYGFPYIQSYEIYLELQLKSEKEEYLVGFYTDKSKYDSANQKIINILKKAENI